MSELVQKLQTRFGIDSFTTTSFAGNVRVNVTADKLFGFLKGLKEEFAFDYLVDIAGIDYLHYPEATDRYGVVYCLANTETAERLFVRAFANDPAPKLPSVYPLWKGADWLEREVYDMFGIVFDGHPDLRRILMPEGFASYPLRKDYPKRGRGERHNFETVSRADS